MKKSDLHYDYPEDLVALEPRRPSRVMRVPWGQAPFETSVEALIDELRPGDVWVINNTRVMPRRVFSPEGLEVLFLEEVSPCHWQVLLPASRLKLGESFPLPGGVTASLEQKGMPQSIKVSAPLDEAYFSKYGELPLPPYIQKLRPNRHQRDADRLWYQPIWAEKAGSLAAPTASLHFTPEHIERIKYRGGHILSLTLHVGIGTFLPVKTENLDEHLMHHEWVEIPRYTWEAIQEARRQGGRVWAVGTTVTRALESMPLGLLNYYPDAELYAGSTSLYIRPGFSYQVLDRLLTNFHQPESTLLALVAAIQGLERTLECYRWAIERRFRLFSYGDLSVWDVQSKTS
jgi:S-adenosylmethionine:tRNA ribosyltransferase-isomerase